MRRVHQWESDTYYWKNLSEGVRGAALAIAMYLPCFRLNPPAIIPNSLFSMKLSFKSFRSFSSSTWRKWANALYRSWRNVSTIESQVFEDNEVKGREQKYFLSATDLNNASPLHTFKFLSEINIQWIDIPILSIQRPSDTKVCYTSSYCIVLINAMII